jgi:hypothetical protein
LCSSASFSHDNREVVSPFERVVPDPANMLEI